MLLPSSTAFQRIFSRSTMYPRLAACFVLLEMFSMATTAPLESATVSTTMETLDCNNDSEVYDQRQNGTENYRIHVNGVVVLVAPAEAVLQAAQLGALQMGQEPDVSNITSQPLKPRPKPPTVTDKVPSESHMTDTVHPKEPKDKNNLKLLNLLHMFRSIRHDSERDVRQAKK